jgi:hypothetical protein
MELKSTKILSEEKYTDLIKIIRKYVNLYKSLHLIDPAIASEFKKKQELYHSKENSKEHSGNCCESKLNNHCIIFNNSFKSLFLKKIKTTSKKICQKFFRIFSTRVILKNY